MSAVENGTHMVSDAAHRITEFLRREVDEALRTVLILEADGWTGVYLRDDLRDLYDRDGYEDVVDQFREFSIGPKPESIGHIGKRRVLVHYHDEAFVFQFPFEAGESILVCIDEDVGQGLSTFVERCREQLYAD